MKNQLATGGTPYAQGKTGNIFNDLYYWGVALGENFAPPNAGVSGSYTIPQQENLYGTVQLAASEVMGTRPGLLAGNKLSGSMG
jgi:hypothetical protein